MNGASLTMIKLLYLPPPLFAILISQNSQLASASFSSFQPVTSFLFHLLTTGALHISTLCHQLSFFDYT